MNEKKIILDFLKWYQLQIPESRVPIKAWETGIDLYMESKEPKEEVVDWFLHTHWTENHA